jgi:hypothetical protein
MGHPAATLALAGSAATAASVPAQISPGVAPPAAGFGPGWRVLIGDWVSVEPAEIATGAAGTSTPHEDLTVIYPAGTGDAARALYVDNEGHVIQYAASWSDDGRALTFVSDAVPGAPRFRLIYEFHSSSDVAIRFEVATPDSPSAFKPYVTGRARRTTSAPAR